MGAVACVRKVCLEARHRWREGGKRARIASYLVRAGFGVLQGGAKMQRVGNEVANAVAIGHPVNDARSSKIRTPAVFGVSRRR